MSKFNGFTLSLSFSAEVDGFIYVNSLDLFEQAICVLHNYIELALDTECYVQKKYKHIGSALDPHTSAISLVILKPRESLPYIFDLILLEQLNYDQSKLVNLLESRTKIVIHNAKYDLKMIKKHLGVMLTNTWCTKVAAQLVANATSRKFYLSATTFSLGSLLRDYLNIHLSGKGTLQVEDWISRPLSAEYVEGFYSKLLYAANDTNYLFQLHDIMLKTLTDPLPVANVMIETSWGLEMGSVLQLEMDFLHVSAELEYNGLPFNSTVNSDFQSSINSCNTQGEMVKAAGKLCEYFKMSAINTPYTDYKVPTEAQLRRLRSSTELPKLINQAIGTHLTNAQAQIIKRYIDLLDEKISSPDGSINFSSADEEASYAELESLENSELLKRHDLLKLIATFKQLSKQNSMNLQKYVNPVTNRIHSGYDQLGAATGRSSSSRPNAQNINCRLYVTSRYEGDLTNYFQSKCLPADQLTQGDSHD